MAVKLTFPANRIIRVEFIEPCDDGVAVFRQAHEVIKLRYEQQGGPLIAIWDVAQTSARFDDVGQDPLVILTVPEENRTMVDHIVIARDDVFGLLQNCRSSQRVESYNDALSHARLILS